MPQSVGYVCLRTAALFSLFCFWLLGDQSVQTKTWLRDSLPQGGVVNGIPTDKPLRRHAFMG